jgi:hypothetical protein
MSRLHVIYDDQNLNLPLIPFRLYIHFLLSEFVLLALRCCLVRCGLRCAIRITTSSSSSKAHRHDRPRFGRCPSLLRTDSYLSFNACDQVCYMYMNRNCWCSSPVAGCRSASFTAKGLLFTTGMYFTRNDRKFTFIFLIFSKGHIQKFLIFLFCQNR